jgi:hypothetical protein
MMKVTNNNIKDQITLKEALSKTDKYAALTAIGTFIILNPKKTQVFLFHPRLLTIIFMILYCMMEQVLMSLRVSNTMIFQSFL